MGDRDAIPSEIAAALDRLAAADITQSAALDRVAGALDRVSEEIRQTYVRRDVHEEQMKAIRDELARHGETMKWATRTAVASLLTVIVGIVLAFGGLP